MSKPQNTSNAGFLDRFFGLSAAGTNIKTEIIAGITTFMAMAYIIAVNPNMLVDPMRIVGAADTDINFYYGVVFNATCIAAAIGTMIMALYANLPFAQAPGMGLNAFFAYTIMLTMGLTFQQGLAAVAVSGILFIIITVFGLREMIVEAIPDNLKHAITAGIGLFIALVGFRNGGLIVNNEATGLSLINFANPENGIFRASAVLTLIGIAIIAILMIKNIKGAILIGIVATTIIGIPMQLTDLSKLQGARWLPQFASGAEYMNKVFPDFGGLLRFTGANTALGAVFGMIMIVIAFSLVDMFDTIGTLIGTGARTGLLDENGRLPRMDKALMADAVATTAGAFMGTSTVTTYIESGTGISEGGKTGLTSVMTALLFLLSLFIAPLVGIIPAAATSPALIIVGVLMMGAVKQINFTDLDDSIPAFITLALMPFTYSIATGIAGGFIFYPIVKIVRGKAKEVHPLIYILAALFILRFAILPE